MTTKIEWTDETWNPITGCTKVSAGCQHCYAERMARRLAGRYGYPPAPHHFDVTLRRDRLEQPLRWKKPRRIFVCSMGDLFHEDVPFEFIGRVFATIIAADWHTFQILTKRPERMRSFISWFQAKTSLNMRSFRHIFLGVTAENQAAADGRIPLLLQTPAAVRFVSCEPLLGPVNLGPSLYYRTIADMTAQCIVSERDHTVIQGATVRSWSEQPGLDWVIVGGESGPGARPMSTEAASSIVQQCKAAGVPVFMKQLGSVWAKRLGLKSTKGSGMSEWPPWDDLKVREYPNVNR